MNADERITAGLARIGRRVEAQGAHARSVLAEHPDIREFLAMAKAAFGIGSEKDGASWYIDTGTDFAGSRVLAAKIAASVPWTPYQPPHAKAVTARRTKSDPILRRRPTT